LTEYHLSQDKVEGRLESTVWHKKDDMSVRDFGHTARQLIGSYTSSSAVPKEEGTEAIMKAFFADLPHTSSLQYTLVEELVLNPEKDPSSYKEAVSRPDAEKWKGAIFTELDNLKRNGVFVEVRRPQNLEKLIGCRYVFKTKMKNGRVDKYKARMVAKGYSQVRERDYNETFAPVARMNSLRIFLKLSVCKGHVRRSIDFTAAFLQAILPEDLYIETPEGMQCREGYVLKLMKSIYGLKQAGRYWYVLLKIYLVEQEGYACCGSDHCIFTNPDLSVLILIYVDDVIISGASEKLIDELVLKLRAKFEIGEEGPVDFFLGMSLEDTGREVSINQTHYIQKIIDRYGYGDLSEVDTPMAEGLSLTKNPDDQLYEDFDIRSKIGSLMFAMVCTRPDICYAVSYLARFTTHPSREVCTAVSRVFRYLKGTLHYGISFGYEAKPNLTVYCDSDFAGDVTDYKSTTGVMVLVGSTITNWYCSKQTITAQSSTDAEIIAMNFATKEIIWMRGLLQELGVDMSLPTRLLCDNQSAIKLAHNPVFHKRTKHIMLKFALLVEHMKLDNLILEFVKSAENLADMFTKSQKGTHFSSNLLKLNLDLKRKFQSK